MVTNDSIWGNLRDRADNDVWDVVGHGVPVSGPGGTGSSICGPGSTYTNIDSAIRYTNTGSKSSPVWTNKEGGGSAATVGFNAGQFTAAGTSQTDATPITTASPASVLVLGGNNNNGCRLPPATAGSVYLIFGSDDQNDGNVMNIYPSGTEVINGGQPSVPVKIRAVSGYVFSAPVAGRWYTSPIP